MISGKLLLGIVAGAVAGAIGGLVVAPAKGSTTRKRIARTGLEYAEDVKEMVVDALTEEYDILKDGDMNWIVAGKGEGDSAGWAPYGM